MHIKLGKNRAYTHKKKIINQTNGYGQVSFHGRFTPLISYALPFSLNKYIILPKNWSCWYPIWIYDLLAQVIIFHIVSSYRLKPDMLEKKTQ